VSMSVGELRRALETMDQQANVMLVVNGAFVSVAGLASAPGASFVAIRGKGVLHRSRRFSVAEEGVIGHLSKLGASDIDIGEVLGRSADHVKKKRIALGF
jgi:hypothetical protein